ncbi:hypothetical protein [Ornithinimicrobium kibberense]|uniref:hypothetical protein n=1 Tax=Ornithinimicrobium kibberense TaxID=282060 RepID=UPI00361AA22E
MVVAVRRRARPRSRPARSRPPSPAAPGTGAGGRVHAARLLGWRTGRALDHHEAMSPPTAPSGTSPSSPGSTASGSARPSR